MLPYNTLCDVTNFNEKLLNRPTFELTELCCLTFEVSHCQDVQQFTAKKPPAYYNVDKNRIE